MRNYLLGVLSGVLVAGVGVAIYKAEKDLNKEAIRSSAPAVNARPQRSIKRAIKPRLRTVKALKVVSLRAKWGSLFGGRYLELDGRVKSLLSGEVIDDIRTHYRMEMAIGRKVARRVGKTAFNTLRSGPLAVGRVGKLNTGSPGAIQFSKAELMYPPKPIRLKLTFVSKTPTGQKHTQSWSFTIPHPSKKRRFALLP